MSRNFFEILLIFSFIFVLLQTQIVASKYLQKEHRQDFSLLIDFTCATAKDELEKHPEMQTIAIVELENDFPPDFSGKVLKCLPQDVAKIILNPHAFADENNTLILPKQTMVIYVADFVLWNKKIFYWNFFYFYINFPVVHHLSKFLVVSSDENEIKTTKTIFRKLLNVVQIYGKNRKVIARSFDMTQNLENLKTFNGSRHENLSQVLFPDKTKNLNGKELYAVFRDGPEIISLRDSVRPISKWTPFLDIIEEKLNATVKYAEIEGNGTSSKAFVENLKESIRERIKEENLDFFLNFPPQKFQLESYNHVEWCLVAPLPVPFSITELILFLPMDKSCWMWLGITITVSTLVWRISEGHWSFAFGAFAFSMGQSQLVNRIRTSRLALKILLQIWIFSIFIFSNGYQSLVTSFMLNPMQQRFLKSLDEVYDSDLKLESFADIKKLQGENPKYQKALQDGRIVDFDVHAYNEPWHKRVVDNHLAFSQPCELMKNRIEHQGDGKSWKELYLIPEVIDTYPNDLYTRPFHPLIDKFQELMDRTFEAGLPKAWERFFWEIWGEGEIRQQKQEESDVLDFSLIAPFFLILVVGFVAGLFALFCEIFHHDFVSELTKNYFEKKFNEIFRRKIKVTKVKAKPKKVKIIEVQPFDRENC